MIIYTYILFKQLDQKRPQNFPIDLAAMIWWNIFLEFIIVPISSLLHKIIFCQRNVHQIASFISNELK